MLKRSAAVVMIALFAVVGLSATGAAAATPASSSPSVSTPTPSTSTPQATATPKLAGRAHKRTCADPTHGHAACFAEVVEGIATPSLASNTAPIGYGPADLRSAYALPATGGAGATVAVIDAYDLGTAESDLATYRSQFGLPACTTANGCFRKVDQNGSTNYPPSDPSHGWGPETAIDLEMVSAACGSCKILLVEAADGSLDNLGPAVNTAVALGARYVTNSYGTNDASTGDFSQWDPYYTHSGVAVTAASGDNGYGAEFPASSRYVTAVGGTTLSPASGTSRGWTESAWSHSGSGCSTDAVKPTWQTDSGCSTKTTSDISAVADPATGVAGFGPTNASPYTSAWQVFGGTSVSSPLIAGIYALAGTPATGTYPASYPYAHRSSLNDVTSGSNGTCTPTYLCTAGTGYDGPTGLGTPNGVSALTGSTPPPPPPPPALKMGDFNSDGTADVLARDGNGILYLYRGNGSAGWLNPAAVQVGSGWNSMSAIVSPGDFDGDGHNDILARDSAGSLWLYPGDGASGWAPRRQVGSGWNSLTVIVAAHDFNGDRTADVLAVDGGGTLWLYPGDGHGSWLAPQAIGSGWNTMSAIVGIRDFTGDGNPDVLARDSSGRLILYPHSPSGWGTPSVVGTGWNSMTAIISVGDFNGDGHDDVLARDASGALILYPATGHSGWGNAAVVGSGWNSMSWIG